MCLKTKIEFDKVMKMFKIWVGNKVVNDKTKYKYISILNKNGKNKNRI